MRNARVTNQVASRLFEYLGARKMFRMIERKLPNEMKDNFETRWAEKYDAKEETNKSMLWSIDNSCK